MKAKTVHTLYKGLDFFQCVLYPTMTMTAKKKESTPVPPSPPSLSSSPCWPSSPTGHLVYDYHSPRQNPPEYPPQLEKEAAIDFPDAVNFVAAIFSIIVICTGYAFFIYFIYLLGMWIKYIWVCLDSCMAYWLPM